MRPTIALVALGLGLALPLGDAGAADHNDPTRVRATEGDVGDPAADIADVFAWHQDGKVILAFTWRIDAAYELEFDPNVLYGLHIDTDQDTEQAEYDIWVRFGASATNPNAWGVKVENVPGTSGPLIGPVGQELGGNGVRVIAGLFDDPFFLDLEGFLYGLSVSLGNPAPSAPWQLDLNRPFGFDNTNDTFKGRNVHGVVVELPATLLGASNNVIRVWATTGRSS